MQVTLSGRIIFNKLTTLIERLVDRRQQYIPPQPIGSLPEELCHLEKTLNDLYIRPRRRVCQTELLEPVTEQQKIIDLAG